MTTRKEWREKRDQGVEILLPEYGDVVRIRPMDATFFLRTGRIPDYLAQTVDELINNSLNQVPVPPKITSDKTVEWMKWLDELVTYAMVSPKVVSTPQADDEISIDDIGYTDKLSIYRWFGQPAQVLRAFRAAQVKSVANVDVAKNNGHTPVTSAEDQVLVFPTAGDAR
jgi:hypothetical protein